MFEALANMPKPMVIGIVIALAYLAFEAVQYAVTRPHPRKRPLFPRIRKRIPSRKEYRAMRIIVLEHVKLLNNEDARWTVRESNPHLPDANRVLYH